MIAWGCGAVLFWGAEMMHHTRGGSAAEVKLGRPQVAASSERNPALEEWKSRVGGR